MKRLPVRKMILLSAIMLLAVIYTFQLSRAARGSITSFTLEETVDAIEISAGDEAGNPAAAENPAGDEAGNPAAAGNPAGALRLSLENGIWLIGEKRYPADPSAVNAMVTALSNIRTPGPVSRNAESGAFGFDTPLVVSVFSQGRKVRTVTVGKVSANSMQTYCRLDSGDAVYLVSGNFRDLFDRSVESLRDKKVYAFQETALQRVVLKSGDGTVKWALERAGDPAAWRFANGSGPVDADKTASWTGSLAVLRVQSWADETVQVPAAPLGSVEITADGKQVTVTVYEKDSDEERYLCTSSETAWPFYVPVYTAERFLRGKDFLAAER